MADNVIEAGSPCPNEGTQAPVARGAALPVRIESLDGIEGGICARLSCETGVGSKRVGSILIQKMPHLAEQQCVHGRGMRRRPAKVRRFGEVAEDTSLAHLVEHVALELLYQAAKEGDFPCKARGFTRCIAQEAGIWEVTVLADERSDTERALRQAVSLVNACA